MKWVEASSALVVKLLISLLVCCISLRSSDIEVLKPGCAGVPTFTYLKKVQLTLALMVIAYAFFFFACLLRLAARIHRFRRNDAQAQAQQDEELLEDDNAAQQAHVGPDGSVVPVLDRPVSLRPQLNRTHSTVARQLSLTHPITFLRTLRSTHAFVGKFSFPARNGG
jgi:large-conductance mechanosensitive channel